MAKLIFLLGLLVAVASAAPVAEESSPSPSVKELLNEADPIENDISAPRSEPTELGKIIDEQIKEFTNAEETADTQTVNEPEDSVKIEDETQETGTNDAEVTEVEEEPIIEDFESDIGSGKASIDGDESQQPEIEEIPLQEVSFVLGDSAVEENPKEEDNYQIVQGETEDGTPIISDFVPDVFEAPSSPDIDQIAEEDVAVVDSDVIPIAEEIVPMLPETDSTAMVAPEDIAFPADLDYDAPLDLTDSHDYVYDYGSIFDNEDFNFDDYNYFEYDTPTSPLTGDDMVNMNHPDIIAGAQETYHPSPISGFDSHDMNQPGPEADYTIYHDEPIIPAAMINTNHPMSEGFPDTDNIDAMPVPEKVNMGDFPVTDLEVVEAALGDNSPALNDIAIAEPIGSNFDMPNPDDAVDFPLNNDDDKPDIVIELNLGNQDAMVNGRPFDLTQSQNILNFIETLIFKAKHTAITEPQDMDSRSTFPSYTTRPFTYRFFDSSFLNPYERDFRDDSPFGSYEDEYDYNPYFPLAKRYIYRSHHGDLNNMNNPYYHNRFGFENNARDRRFAYNPIWF